MIARMSHRKPLRIAAGAFAVLLGALALVGCGDSYPKDLEYGVRTDPIVLARPEKSPSDFGSPGSQAVAPLTGPSDLRGRGASLPSHQARRVSLGRVAEYRRQRE